MIHRLLALTRPLFVLDTETTGTDPQNDRIVEIGFEQWGPDGLIKEWRSLINPGMPIPAAATKVHRITDAMVTSCQVCGHPREGHDSTEHALKVAPLFRQLAPSFAIGFKDCDYGGKRVRFDLRIMSAEMRRAGVKWSYAGARIVDADRLEQLAIPRSLSHLHEKYVGYKHDGAHGALSDVRASTTVIVKQLETHAMLPRDLDALHEAQWEGWLDSEGLFRVIDGVPTCAFGKHRGKTMRDVPVDYYDWLCSDRASFGPDVKALAQDARLGKFPEVK